MRAGPDPTSVAYLNSAGWLCTFHPPCVLLCPPPAPQLCPVVRAALGTCPDVCGNHNIPPMLRAPFYGLLMTQMALSGLPKILTVR